MNFISIMHNTGVKALENFTSVFTYYKSGKFRCKNIFVADGGYEN